MGRNESYEWNKVQEKVEKIREESSKRGEERRKVINDGEERKTRRVYAFPLITVFAINFG